MFGTIRRHQTWLWVIIIALTVISFVIFGPTNTRVGDALSRSQGQFGTINGKQITQDQYINASREAALRYLVMNGQWPDSDPNSRRTFNEAKEVYQRLFLISKEEELGVQPSTEAVARYAHEMLGKEASLDAFVEKTLRPRGLSAADFERFVRHELGIQQLVGVAGLSGKLVTPQEAEELYRREHQDLSASMVYFSGSNYMASVMVNSNAISQFYSNQLANYRIPPRVQVDYVKFNLTNFMTQVQSKMTNLTQEVEAVYKQYGTNAALGAKSPEEAKTKIKEQLLRQGASTEARRSAIDFAQALDKLETKNLSTFEKLAKEKGLKVATSAPFDQRNPPENMEVSESFVRSAFGLNKEEPFAGPVQGNDGWYVMALKQTLPDEIPSLQSIEAKVTADYRFYQGYLKAQQAGRAFANALTNTNGLAAGKTFAAIAAEAKVKPETLPPFSLSTRNLPEEIESKINLARLKDIAFRLPEGKSSPFVPTQDGGLVLYVQAHLPLDEAKVKKELPEFQAYVRQMRQNDAFNQWFSKQLDRDPAFKQTLIQAAEGPQQLKKGAAPRSARS
ncbi:MAG: hypothetical protein JWQ71_2645 [Pedosphaera sp.]|nr:hypothetical protein [Pedosphaera sp.]